MVFVGSESVPFNVKNARSLTLVLVKQAESLTVSSSRMHAWRPSPRPSCPLMQAAFRRVFVPRTLIPGEYFAHP